MALEPQKVLQELTNSDSDRRKKLDGFTRFCIGGAKDMMDVNIGKRDLESLESETKYDLRKSLAWDSAFSTNPGILEPEELNGCDILRHEENQLLSAKYLEPETKSVTAEIKLRKSLAWDSAFSTCEGVLNHEELSLVNKGFKKSEIRILPRIEELWMSCESNCTIDSERSSLACLEVELFEDIKASMHNLSEASSTLASKSRKERYRNMQKFNSTKKVDGDGVPKLKVKFRSTSRSQTINGNQPERVSKESSTPLLRKISAESGVSETSSPLKPPKILERGRRNIPVAPTKRVSLVSNEVNGERKIVQATNGKCLIVKPNPGKTCSDNLSSSPSSQISSFSPQSSMNDSCSPMSPTSEDLKCHDSMTSANESCTKSCIDSDATAESDLEVKPHGQNSGSHDGKGSMCSNPCTEVKLKGSKSVSSDASRIIKPSCLRMPSPKIGFFDVDDSLVPMENGGVKSHSGVQNTVPKVGACNKNFNGYANRSRRRKIQIAQTLKDITAKIFPQQTRRSLISRTMNSKS